MDRQVYKSVQGTYSCTDARNESDHEQELLAILAFAEMNL